MGDRPASRQWLRPRESSPELGRMVAVGLAILAVITVGVWLWKKGEQSRFATDPNTLCPIDRAPSEVLVLLLDMSDEFSEPQRLKITNDLSMLQSGIQRFGLIDVYAIDGAGGRVIRPVLQLCNPGKGDDLNALYQNPGLAKKRWEEFSERLNSELARLMSASGAPTSPIMEAIQATALRTFNLPRNKGLQKRLFVVSDLLQHVPGRLSHYESIPAFDTFKKTPYFTEIRADLTEVNVTILYLVRTRAPQPWPAHRLFWEQYFQAQGATVDRIEPIFGGK
jgi:hypothetical protein